jgi:multidrug resistance efflux pump
MLAKIELLLDGTLIYSKVESIANSIADREANDTRELIQDINPTFNWIRIAQRIRVRIKPGRLAPNIAAGMTCTLRIIE